MFWVLIALLSLNTLAAVLNTFRWIWYRTTGVFLAMSFNWVISYVGYLTIMDNPAFMSEATKLYELGVNYVSTFY